MVGIWDGLRQRIWQRNVPIAGNEPFSDLWHYTRWLISAPSNLLDLHGTCQKDWGCTGHNQVALITLYRSCCLLRADTKVVTKTTSYTTCARGEIWIHDLCCLGDNYRFTSAPSDNTKICTNWTRSKCHLVTDILPDRSCKGSNCSPFTLSSALSLSSLWSKGWGHKGRRLSLSFFSFSYGGMGAVGVRDASITLRSRDLGLVSFFTVVAVLISSGSREASTDNKEKVSISKCIFFFLFLNFTYTYFFSRLNAFTWCHCTSNFTRANKDYCCSIFK